MITKPIIARIVVITPSRFDTNHPEIPTEINMVVNPRKNASPPMVLVFPSEAFVYSIIEPSVVMSNTLVIKNNDVIKATVDTAEVKMSHFFSFECG